MRDDNNSLLGDVLLESNGVFEGLNKESVLALLKKAADLSMRINADGRIAEVEVSAADLVADVDQSWVGKIWVDTVKESSRARIDELVGQTKSAGRSPGWYDIIHQRPDGSELPISYFTVSSGEDDGLIAVGRDLRVVAALRQQLVNAQIALEKDYWRLRQVETRYRMVFQMVDEAVLLVDDRTEKVLEANDSASRGLGPVDASVVGKSLTALFDEQGAESVRALLSETRIVGRGSAIAVKAADGGREFSINANLLKQDSESRLLLKLAEAGAASLDTESIQAGVQTGNILHYAPDAVLITDVDGLVLATNPMFVALAELINEDQAIGQSVDKWFGRSAVDLNVLLGHLRRGETVRLFATTLRSEHRNTAEVEISASSFSEQDKMRFVFFVRDVARRLSSDNPATNQLPRSVAQITQQVGRVPLKALVRQSTDVVEKLCIETALELTGDNRASAAELLGLSRQSLYSKLRRHNLGDIGSDDVT